MWLLFIVAMYSGVPDVSVTEFKTQQACVYAQRQIQQDYSNIRVYCFPKEL